MIRIVTSSIWIVSQNLLTCNCIGQTLLSELITRKRCDLHLLGCMRNTGSGTRLMEFVCGSLYTPAPFIKMDTGSCDMFCRPGTSCSRQESEFFVRNFPHCWSSFCANTFIFSVFVMPIGDQNSIIRFVTVVQVAIWIMFFHIFHDERTKNTIHFVVARMRVIIIRARITLGRNKCVTHGIIGSDRTLIDISNAIHPRCAMLQHSMPMNWFVKAGHSIFHIDDNDIEFTDLYRIQ